MFIVVLVRSCKKDSNKIIYVNVLYVTFLNYMARLLRSKDEVPRIVISRNSRRKWLLLNIALTSVIIVIIMIANNNKNI